jgi:hypothetical protein
MASTKLVQPNIPYGHWLREGDGIHSSTFAASLRLSTRTKEPDKDTRKRGQGSHEYTLCKVAEFLLITVFSGEHCMRMFENDNEKLAIKAIREELDEPADFG